ncbi:MAG: helix-turn-helix domain-containing protein [Anaerolineales bacterium]
MDLFSERKNRLSDSPHVELIQHARVANGGTTIRPGEMHWHMVLARHNGESMLLIVGPWTSSGVVSVPEDAEVLWIKFKLGAFMPHLPTREFLNTETILPGAASSSFWLHGSAWQFPDYENVDTFVARLAREEVLVHDPLVDAVLQDHPQQLSARAVRHRFLRATGLTQSHVRQFERAQRAAALLQQGVSILDTAFQVGYFDQPHLTRSLKHWIGHTPAQLSRLAVPA